MSANSRINTTEAVHLQGKQCLAPISGGISTATCTNADLDNRKQETQIMITSLRTNR